MTETKNIAAALAAFQGEMPTVAKSKTAKAGSFSYTYAGLADVTSHAAPILAKHGLAFTALPGPTEHGWVLNGVLLHVSGEKLEGALPIKGGSPQEWGSSLSYFRRYLLGCLTGLVTDDDDDGQMAPAAAKKRAPEGEPAPTRRMSRPAPAADEATDPNAITAKQLGLLHMQFGKAGITDRELGLEYLSRILGRVVESSKSLTKAEASTVLDALKADIEVPA